MVHSADDPPRVRRNRLTRESLLFTRRDDETQDATGIAMPSAFDREQTDIINKLPEESEYPTLPSATLNLAALLPDDYVRKNPVTRQWEVAVDYEAADEHSQGETRTIPMDSLRNISASELGKVV